MKKPDRMTLIEELGLNKIISSVASEAQGQTSGAFGFKWAKRNTYESETVTGTIRQWLLERYCDGDAGNLDTLFGAGNKIIVDAGCGSGNAALLLFGELLNSNRYLGIDISDSVDVAKEKFSEKKIKGEFFRISINDFHVPAHSIDIIFSEGVLHHTDNTEQSFRFLSKKIKPGGYFMFYVYAKKAVIREFTDDFIREKLKSLSDEDSWNALYGLTKLGKGLGELNAKIKIEEDIPLLEIKKGAYDIQRFFYWNIIKLFYRPDFNLEEMNHINFDWFRPLNCHRHTPEEVERWCRSEGFAIERMNIQEAGITVIAKKN